MTAIEVAKCLADRKNITEPCPHCKSQNVLIADGKLLDCKALRTMLSMGKNPGGCHLIYHYCGGARNCPFVKSEKIILEALPAQ